MKFGINVSFSIDRNKSLKKGNRKAYIRHERREHGYTANPSIDPKLSKYNNIDNLGYNDYYNFDNAIQKTVQPYINHHNNLKSVKQNPNRKITSLHKFLMDRGSRIPYKFVVIKLGTGDDEARLIQLFHQHGFTTKDFFKAFDSTVHDYGSSYNDNHNHLSFDHLDANVDEVKRHGTVHAHGAILSTATTKSGKTSLSFDRGTRVEYGGKSNIGAWDIMRNKEDHQFLKIATKNFQKYLGPSFQFDLERNPKSSSGMAHKDFVRTKTLQDRYIKKSKDYESKLNQTLMRRNSALINQNKRLRNRVQYLQETTTTHAYNDLVDKSNHLITKYINPLVEQNQRLSALVSSLRYDNRRLQKLNRQSRKLNVDDTDILRGLPSWLEDIQHKQTIVSELRLTHRQALRKRLDKDNHDLATMISNNNNWNHEWYQYKEKINIIKGINRLSPKLRKALVSLANGSDSLLIEYLTDLLESEKNGQGND